MTARKVLPIPAPLITPNGGPLSARAEVLRTVVNPRPHSLLFRRSDLI